MRRKLVNAGFTRKRLKVQESPSVSSLCDTLIDAVCERGECDFVWDLAAPLPMAVIGDMLGVLPDEREMFLKWSDDNGRLSSTVSEADIQVTMDAFMAYNDYIRSKIEQRGAEPTDDLISVLVHAEVDGERLSEDDDRAGDSADPRRRRRDDPPHDLRWHRQLIRHPEQWDLSQNDLELIPSAIEEMLRWTSPREEHGANDHRRHGVSRRPSQSQGEKMMLMFESANFDEKPCSGIRTTSIFSEIPTATWRSASARTSALATSWPASS